MLKYYMDIFIENNRLFKATKKFTFLNNILIILIDFAICDIRYYCIYCLSNFDTISLRMCLKQLNSIENIIMLWINSFFKASNIYRSDSNGNLILLNLSLKDYLDV